MKIWSIRYAPKPATDDDDEGEEEARRKETPPEYYYSFYPDNDGAQEDGNVRTTVMALPMDSLPACAIRIRS